MALRRRFSRKFALLTVLAAAALLTSGIRRIAPEWTVEVRDESGQAVSGVSVSQFFNDYTLDEARNEWETLCTDSSGRVTFPRRATWAWPGEVIVATIAKVPAFFRMCGPSFGTASHILVSTGTNMQDDSQVSVCSWYTTTGGGAARLTTCTVRAGWTPTYGCEEKKGG